MGDAAARESSVHDDSDSTDFYANSPPRQRHTDATEFDQENAPLKRKLDEAHSQISDKRQKTQSPIYQPHSRAHCTAKLPCELWQHVFRFLPPANLAILVRVCRHFQQGLNSPHLSDLNVQYQGALRIEPSEHIWNASRTRWLPNAPSSTPACSEAELIRLLFSKKCQFCKRAPTPQDDSSPWTMGPGARGVRLIWPFLIRSCGQCLDQRVQTVSSLQFSDYAAVLPAASFCFLTQHKNIVSSSAFRCAGEIPSDVNISKVYFLPQLEQINILLQQTKERNSSDAAILLQRLTAHQEMFQGLIQQWEEWHYKNEGIYQGLDATQLADQDRIATPVEPIVKTEDEGDEPFSGEHCK